MSKKEIRVYWCKGCKNLFDEEKVPIGKTIRQGKGKYATYLCEKCAEKEIEKERYGRR